MTDGFNYSLQQVEDLVTREFGWAGEISSTGDFVCYCPIHGDKKASLHVCLKDGRILIRCWSHGCEKQIYSDLSSRGAWPQQLESKEIAEKENRTYEKKYPERAQSKFKWNSLPVSHNAAVRQSLKLKETMVLKDKTGARHNFHKKMVHVYTDGDFAHSIVARYDAAGQNKRIMQYSFGYFDEHEEPNRPTDPNNPAWQVKGWSSETKHMIYALTYVSSCPTDTVVIVEGEKAADYGNTQIKSIHHNFVFTTWKGGTQAVPFTDWSPLKGRTVIIIPDADEPGIAAAAEVYNEIREIADVTIVDVAQLGLPDKWDIADYPDTKQLNVPRFLDLISGEVITNEIGEAPPLSDEIIPFEEVDDEDAFQVKKVVFPFAFDMSHKTDALKYFNQRFGKLSEGGKLNVVEISQIRSNPESAVIPEQTFHSANQHIHIQLSDKGPLRPASKFWLKHDHRSFDKAVVHPSGPAMFFDDKKKSCVNLWPGVAAEEMDQSGSCKRFLEHLEFICSSESKPEELHKFILVFLARMMQTPHNRQGAILLLRGKQGSGKSIVGEYLRRMLGDKAALTVNKLDRVTGQFNSQLTGKLLCRVEEAKIPKNAEYEALKDLSVNPTFTMEAKGKAQVIRDNFIHFIFTGNYDYIAPVSEKERRLVPIDVPDKKIGNVKYFEAIVEEMEGEGPGALYKYLKEYPLPKSFLPIPQTEALSSQRSQTKSYSRESAFLDWYSRSLKNKGLQSGPTGPSFMPWVQGREEDRVEFWNRFAAWQKENLKIGEHLTRRFFYRYFEEFQSGFGRLNKVIDNKIKGRFASRYSGTQLLTFPMLKDAKDTFMVYVGQDDTYDVYEKSDAQDELEMEEGKEHEKENESTSV